MKSRVDFERKGGVRANSVRALVAALCVLGLVGLTLFHFDDGGGFASRLTKATSPENNGPVANSSFLRAPAGDPSLPSLEATFSRKDATPADEAPAPTF